MRQHICKYVASHGCLRCWRCCCPCLDPPSEHYHDITVCVGFQKWPSFIPRQLSSIFSTRLCRLARRQQYGRGEEGGRQVVTGRLLTAAAAGPVAPCRRHVPLAHQSEPLPPWRRARAVYLWRASRRPMSGSQVSSGGEEGERRRSL